MTDKEEKIQSLVEDAFDHAFSEAMATDQGCEAAAKSALKAAHNKAKALGVRCHIDSTMAADMTRLAKLCDITDDDYFDEEDLEGWEY